MEYEFSYKKNAGIKNQVSLDISLKRTIILTCKLGCYKKCTLFFLMIINVLSNFYMKAFKITINKNVHKGQTLLRIFFLKMYI